MPKDNKYQNYFSNIFRYFEPCIEYVYYKNFSTKGCGNKGIKNYFERGQCFHKYHQTGKK